MARVALEAKIRVGNKKRDLNVIKREGFIPGIIYGKKIETQKIMFKKNELVKALRKCSTGSTVDLNLEGQNTMAIIKEIQYHNTTKEVIHIDLQQVQRDTKVRVRIPIQVINKGAVENSMAVVQEQIKDVEIQALPQYLPEVVIVDASKLTKGEPIKIKDLDLFNDENVEILEDPEQVVISLTVSSAADEAAAGEESNEENLTSLYL